MAPTALNFDGKVALITGKTKFSSKNGKKIFLIDLQDRVRESEHGKTMFH